MNRLHLASSPATWPPAGSLSRAARALLAVLVLPACGGGGGAGGATGTPAPPPVTVSTIGCEADRSVRLATGGDLLNNAWNAGAAAGFAWSQCLVERRQGTQVDYGWTWRWPDNGEQVFSYPSITLGAKPWFGGAGNDPRFPRRIADTPRLLLSYDVEGSSSGNVNLAASMWFTRTTATPLPAVESDISTEIMVWSDYTPVLVSSEGGLTERGRISVGGRSWRVFAAEDWGDASGGTSHRWRIAIYVAEQTTRTLEVDLRAFIDDAIARGLLDPTHAVANVELGNEISSGSGNTWVKRFSVTVP